jgi:hypothetical protein
MVLRAIWRLAVCLTKRRRAPQASIIYGDLTNQAFAAWKTSRKRPELRNGSGRLRWAIMDSMR